MQTPAFGRRLYFYRRYLMNKSFILTWLGKNRKRLLLYVMPFSLVLGLVLLWPKQSCEKMMVKMDEVAADPYVDQLRLTLDTLALISHCDSFSVIYEKRLWVYGACAHEKRPIREVFDQALLHDDVADWMQKHHIGAVHYHFPSMSMEFTGKTGDPYNYRLVYSLKKIGTQPAKDWLTCDRAKQFRPKQYFTRISDHWYMSAFAR